MEKGGLILTLMKKFPFLSTFKVVHNYLGSHLNQEQINQSFHEERFSINKNAQ